MSANTMTSVPTEHTFDWNFAKKAPFGILMTLETVLPLAAVIVLWTAPFLYEGLIFFQGTALTLSIGMGIILLFHILGLHRKVFEIRNGIVFFFPLSLMFFGFSVLFFFIFAFNSLMSVVGLFDSFRFTIRMIITYVIVTCLSVATTLALFRSSVLLFRAAPNGRILDLITVICEGDKTVRTPGSIPTFTPATSPTGHV